MLTEHETKEIAAIHRDSMDFLHELACKYNMTNFEVQRLCAYMFISYPELRHHILETKNVQH